MSSQEEEVALTPELKELISSLPRQKAWVSYLYQYQGFWYPIKSLKGVISFQKHLEAKDSDIFLATTPKSGTTWLKAIMYTLLNRKQHPLLSENHPLLTRNPHDLVPFLEYDLYADEETPSNIAHSSASPRLFSTHVPHVSLPESVNNCKVVYLCRNPKDLFVSLWLFSKKLNEEMGADAIGELFHEFCEGVSIYGPYWDHALQYWKQSRESPQRVFFIMYEEMQEQPALHLRRLAEFLNCSFTADEEGDSVVEQILKLCSFDHLSNLDVNKNGKLVYSGVENSMFFRRGQVGDWKNCLSTDMAEKLDRITRDKGHVFMLHYFPHINPNRVLTRELISYTHELGPFKALTEECI